LYPGPIDEPTGTYQRKASVSSDTRLALLPLAEVRARLYGPQAVTELAREADRNLTEVLGADHPKSARARELLAAAGG
jgi:hypothetical protein